MIYIPKKYMYKFVNKNNNDARKLVEDIIMSNIKEISGKIAPSFSPQCSPVNLQKSNNVMIHGMNFYANKPKELLDEKYITISTFDSGDTSMGMSISNQNKTTIKRVLPDKISESEFIRNQNLKIHDYLTKSKSEKNITYQLETSENKVDIKHGPMIGIPKDEIRTYKKYQSIADINETHNTKDINEFISSLSHEQQNHVSDELISNNMIPGNIVYFKTSAHLGSRKFYTELTEPLIDHLTTRFKGIKISIENKQIIESEIKNYWKEVGIDKITNKFNEAATDYIENTNIKYIECLDNEFFKTLWRNRCHTILTSIFTEAYIHTCSTWKNIDRISIMAKNQKESGESIKSKIIDIDNDDTL